MRSSNNLIRSTSSFENVQKWSPVEFSSEIVDTKDFIQLDAEKFFGIKNDVKDFKRDNLIRSTDTVVGFQSWMPSEMIFDRTISREEEGMEWIPFIEKPNPKKIADQIIVEAQNEAKSIIDQAQNEASKIRQDAYDEGAQTIHNEMTEYLKAAASVINVAREWREDLMRQAEPMVLDLVKKIGQTMFGNGLKLENEVLQNHFSEILESARALGDLRIFMNPEDAKVLGPDWREYQSSIMGSKVEIVSNDSIKRGGCYIQGEWGTADALVETQLNAILEQFSEVEKPTEGDE